MKTLVQLPAGPLIDEWLFCRAIAQAIQPADEKSFTGIDCIEGKTLTVHVPPSAPTFGSEDGAAAAPWLNRHMYTGAALDPLPQALPVDPVASAQAKPVTGDELQTGEVLKVPYQLSDDDRRILEALLPHLPPLRYPVSAEEWASFMAAYSKLPNRPVWEPTLITAKRIAEYKTYHGKVMDDHRARLQEEVRLGKVIAVNPTSRVPVPKLSFGDAIPRDQAIGYLKRCGIAHDEETKEMHQDAEFQEADLDQAPKNVKKAIGRVNFSPEKKLKVVEYYYKQKDKGINNFTSVTAKKFGIETRTVQNYVAEHEKATSIFPSSITKKRS